MIGAGKNIKALDGDIYKNNIVGGDVGLIPFSRLYPSCEALATADHTGR